MKVRGKPRQPNRRFTAPDGSKWHSRGEYLRWLVLQQMERNGEIQRLDRQLRIDLVGANGPILSRASGRKRQMVWDFRYFEGNHCVYEDFKGHPEEMWELKADIFANAYPNVTLRISNARGVTPQWK